MKVFFFTVADPQTGLGHLFRCDALAEAFARNNIEVQLVVDCKSGYSWLAEKPLYSDWIILPWLNNVAIVESKLQHCDIPVFDAYDVDDRVWEYLRNRGRFSVLFDDYGEKPPLKGLVINGSPGASMIAFSEMQDRMLLLGPRYQILRPPFWTRIKRVASERVKCIGVMIGGTDHLDIQTIIVKKLASTLSSNIKINVIGNPYTRTVARNIDYIGFLNAQEVKSAFESFDLLISAAGQTIAEAVSVCLPTLMIKTTENQDYNYRGWADRYYAAIPFNISNVEYNMDDFIKSFHRIYTFPMREKLIKNCEAIDLANSTKRVVDIIGDYFERFVAR